MAKKNENDYFQMLAEMAQCACNAAEKLYDVFGSFNVDRVQDQMKELHEIEHAGDELKHVLVQKLIKEFITPIEREDIMIIAGHIDDVTDAVEDILQQVYIFYIRSIRPEAMEFCGLIKQCCNELLKLMREFGNFRKSQTIHNSVVELNRLEEIGDALYVRVVHDLYTKRGDPVEVSAWTEVYRCFEKCCDTCEHVANLVENVMMKNT